MVELFQRAAEHTALILDGIDESQYESATPCAEWDVGDLIHHLVGSTRYYAAELSGGGHGEPGENERPADAYRAAVAVVLEAFADPATMERTFPTPAGDLSGAQLLPVFFTEAVFHGWDLATATSQDSTIPDDIGAAALVVAEQGSEVGRALGVYGPVAPVADDAPDAIKALALVGRTA